MSILTKKWGIISRYKRFIYRIIFNRRLAIDSSVTFRNGFHMVIEENASVSIGRNVFFNNYCSINAMNNITIGDDCLFGENVKIYDHNHKFRLNTPIVNQGFSVGAVKIGNNCWIGSGVIILKNANIGNHCVIAAGVVIDGVVEDNTVVYRNGEIKKIQQI